LKKQKDHQSPQDSSTGDQESQNQISWQTNRLTNQPMLPSPELDQSLAFEDVTGKCCGPPPVSQGSYGHGKPGKVMEFQYGYFQVWKSPWKIAIFLALRVTEKFVRHSNSSSGIIHYHVYAEISQNIWSWKFGLKSWKSHGNPLVKMCMNPGSTFFSSPVGSYCERELSPMITS